MADTQVLGTCVFGRAGSSPASRTNILYLMLMRSTFLRVLGLEPERPYRDD